MPRMDLLSPCVPVGWRVALLGRLGEDVDVGLDGGLPGSLEYICFTQWSSRWPLDRLGREWALNQILQGDCLPILFLVYLKRLTT